MYANVRGFQIAGMNFAQTQATVDHLPNAKQVGVKPRTIPSLFNIPRSACCSSWIETTTLSCTTIFAASAKGPEGSIAFDSLRTKGYVQSSGICNATRRMRAPPRCQATLAGAHMDLQAIPIWYSHPHWKSEADMSRKANSHGDESVSASNSPKWVCASAWSGSSIGTVDGSRRCVGQRLLAASVCINSSMSKA